MPFLLDTNVWIVSFRGRQSLVTARVLNSARPQDIFLCSIVKAELLFGAVRSLDPPRNLQLLGPIFSGFVSLPFDDAAAKHYADLRTHLERQGRPIGANDMFIAAIAMANPNIAPINLLRL
jgi:tRNA(fMet)-specific endonuclease VapC